MTKKHGSHEPEVKASLAPAAVPENYSFFAEALSHKPVIEDAAIGGVVGGAGGLVLSAYGPDEIGAVTGGVVGAVAEGAIGTYVGYEKGGIKGALIGGAGGVALGGVTGSAEGAALPALTLGTLGALAGAAVGGTVGYITEKAPQVADEFHHGLAVQIASAHKARER